MAMTTAPAALHLRGNTRDRDDDDGGGGGGVYSSTRNMPFPHPANPMSAGFSSVLLLFTTSPLRKRA